MNDAISQPVTRRHAIAGLLAPLLATGGCTCQGGSAGSVMAVWGRRGIAEGRMLKPRAIAQRDGELFIVDMTARIQVFDSEGQFLRGWRTPQFENGKPSGLSIGRDGNLLVADTHYFRLLVYTPDGHRLDQRTIGGTHGQGPGEFGFVTDAVQDSEGNLYVAEYGGYDRIQKFSPAGEYLAEWGSHGQQPGQFNRPQNLAIDPSDQIWVADACNHRVQVFDTDGNLVGIWGTQGYDPGQLRYPYDLALDGQGHVYISEYGNNRVQKFTLDGKPLGHWGTHGRGEGQLNTPWALVYDDRGHLFVLDSMNHRVQQITL